MLALAAIILITGHAGAVRLSAKYTATPPPLSTDDVIDDLISSSLRKLDIREDTTWPQQVVRCARELGISKCMKAFAVCRARRAATATSQGKDMEFDIGVEIERQFPWKEFSNSTEDQLDTLLLDRAAKLFGDGAVTLTYPGVVLDVDSKRNGSLHVAVRQDNTSNVYTGRSRRWQKRFYRILPFLLFPQLINSIVVPIVFPILKFKAMIVLIINLIAFGLSIFNLLRFDDSTYLNKVVYVREPHKQPDDYPPFPEGSSFQEIGQEKYPFGGPTLHNYPVDSLRSETYFPADLEMKKRRLNKHKKIITRRRPVSFEPFWGPGGINYVEETPQTVGIPNQYNYFQETGPEALDTTVGLEPPDYVNH